MMRIYPKKEYNLKKTLINSGQSFCWFEQDDWLITGVSKGDSKNNKNEVIKVKQEKDFIEVDSNINEVDYIKSRLGLNSKNREMLEVLENTEFINFEIDSELRIVEDPLFQTTISFINSSANNIKRIRNSQQKIYESGEMIGFKDKRYNIYPSPPKLNNIDLSDKGLGYRKSYIEDTTQKFCDGFRDKIGGNNLEKDKELLMSLDGVGEKVSDCICLYSLGYTSVIPVDTWIDKYLDEKNLSVSSIKDKLGKNSGLWQLQVYNKYRD